MVAITASLTEHVAGIIVPRCRRGGEVDVNGREGGGESGPRDDFPDGSMIHPTPPHAPVGSTRLDDRLNAPDRTRGIRISRAPRPARARSASTSASSCGRWSRTRPMPRATAASTTLAGFDQADERAKAVISSKVHHVMYDSCITWGVLKCGQRSISMSS
jgi:hypothetical protein